MSLQSLLLVQFIFQLTDGLSFPSSFFNIERSSSLPLLRRPAANSIPQNKSVASAVVVTVVRTNDDVQSLADLRYHEWIVNIDGSIGSGNTDQCHHHRPPSLSSFRLATSDIYHERVAEGSTMFLATMEEDVINSNHGNGNDNKYSSVVAVGAAELSPIELQGVFEEEEDDVIITNVIKPMYITDVVTSSSFRNRGIGSNLMHFVENYAWEVKGTRILYLHVAEENIGARKFYERLGYRHVTVGSRDNYDDDDKDSNSQSGIGSTSLLDEQILCSKIENGLIAMDYDRLAANAGVTEGQILMMKQLSGPSSTDEYQTSQTSTSTSSTTFESSPEKSSILGGGGGFGRRQKVGRKRKR